MTTLVSPTLATAMSEKIHVNGKKPEVPRHVGDWPNEAGVSQPKDQTFFLNLILYQITDFLRSSMPVSKSVSPRN
jgi:hypothetical protein